MLRMLHQLWIWSLLQAMRRLFSNITTLLGSIVALCKKHLQEIHDTVTHLGRSRNTTDNVLYLASEAR